MKNWMKNIICSREWTGIASGMDREWSRITLTKQLLNPIFTLTFLFLILGGFTMSAWGDDPVPVYNSGTWYSLYDYTTVYTNEGKTSGSNDRDGTKFHIVPICPPTTGETDNLTLQWKKGDWWPGCNIWVNNETIAGVNVMTSDHTSLENAYATIGKDATSFELGIHISSKTGYVQNLKIPMAKHIRVNDGTTEGASVGKENVDKTMDATLFGSTSAVYPINLRSFLMEGTSINYVIENDDDDTEFHFGSNAVTKSYDVKANSCAFTGGTANCYATATDLGNPSLYGANVYFTPKENKSGNSTATLYIKDGSTTRVTINLTASVIPTYYFQATAVATAGSAAVKASFTVLDEETIESATASTTTSVVASVGDESTTTTAYFYAPEDDGNDYYFHGWYAKSDCSDERITEDNNLTRTITSTSLNSASPTVTTYYAKYLREIHPIFYGTDQAMQVGDTYRYDGNWYIRTSSTVASSSSSDGFWYEITGNVPAGITTGSDHPLEIISYDPETRVVTAHNAGTATLVFHQEYIEGNYYVDTDHSYVFTVSKKANALLVDGESSYSNSISFSETDEVAYTATGNTDYEHFPIYVSAQTAGENVATYDVVDNHNGLVTPTYSTGTATWRIVQDESYMYAGANNTFSVTTHLNDASQCVNSGNIYAYALATERDVTDAGIETDTWSLPNDGDQLLLLSFDVLTNDKGEGLFESNTCIHIDQFVNDEWDTSIGKVKGSLSANNYVTITKDTRTSGDDAGKLNPKATKIRFRHEGKGWLKVKNVFLRRTGYITTSEDDVTIDENSSSEDIRPYDSGTAEITINYGISNGGNISITSDNPKFTVSPSSITVSDCSAGTETLTITYTSAVSGEDEAHIIIGNNVYRTVVDVTGVTAEAEASEVDGDFPASKLWSDITTWDVEPDKTRAVEISNDVIIDEPVEVYSFEISGEAKVSIAPTGGLTVGAGGLIGATSGNLTLTAINNAKDEDKGMTAYIRISPDYEGDMPSATIELYSKAYYDFNASDKDNTAAWQYVGIPIDTDSKAKTFFTDSRIYTWQESTGSWINERKTLVMEPFIGYITTQFDSDEGMTVEFKGTLIDHRYPVEKSLSYTNTSLAPGCNVLANSFAAPIDISRFVAGDFSYGVQPTIFLFNTGSKSDMSDPSKAADIDAPGQYVSIPVLDAEEMHTKFSKPIVIPAMQGFYVQTDRAGTVKLDYERLVWNADYSEHENRPLRAPKQNAEEDSIHGALQITLFSDAGFDHLYMLASDSYASEYEPGYDARKMMSENDNLPSIFAVEEEQHLSVDATSDLAGTQIGIRTGEDVAYTMVFSHLQTEENLALLDKDTQQEIAIEEKSEYLFYAAPNEMITERFMIVTRSNAPAITTDMDNTHDEAKTQKFVKDNSLYIYKDGVLYNALGERVR